MSLIPLSQISKPEHSLLVSYAKPMWDMSLQALAHPPTWAHRSCSSSCSYTQALGNQGCSVRPCVCLASPLSRVRTCEGGSSQSSRQQEEERVLAFSDSLQGNLLGFLQPQPYRDACIPELFVFLSTLGLRDKKWFLLLAWSRYFGTSHFWCLMDHLPLSSLPVVFYPTVLCFQSSKPQLCWNKSILSSSF